MLHSGEKDRKDTSTQARRRADGSLRPCCHFRWWTLGSEVMITNVFVRLSLYTLALTSLLMGCAGIAGQVSMDVNGDRNGDFSLMAMTNIEAGTYEVVANYFGVNGTFQLLPAFNSDSFTLRGRHKAHTEMSDKSCGLGVSALTGVIVGAVLGTVMLVTFYFFRKNYRITIERRIHNEEEDTRKHRHLREDSIRTNFSAA